MIFLTKRLVQNETPLSCASKEHRSLIIFLRDRSLFMAGGGTWILNWVICFTCGLQSSIRCQGHQEDHVQQHIIHNPKTYAVGIQFLVQKLEDNRVAQALSSSIRNHTLNSFKLSTSIFKIKSYNTFSQRVPVLSNFK